MSPAILGEKMLVTIKEQADIFCDAFVGNNNGILLMSIFGRNTSIHQFISRLELPYHEGGIETLNFNAIDVFDGSCGYKVFDAKNLKKISGKVYNTIYGDDLLHMFVYNKSTTKIDYGNNSTVILENDNAISSDQLWSLIKELSPIPLLDSWKQQVLSLCNGDDYITRLKGYGINAFDVNLNAKDFEQSISMMLKNESLPIN